MKAATILLLIALPLLAQEAPTANPAPPTATTPAPKPTHAPSYEDKFIWARARAEAAEHQLAADAASKESAEAFARMSAACGKEFQLAIDQRRDPFCQPIVKASAIPTTPPAAAVGQ